MDYLGRGIHSQLFEQMNEILKSSNLFEGRIAHHKKRMIEDITSPHVSYWESKQKILNEMDEILAADFGIFEEAEKIALQSRRKMFANPKANNIQVNLQSGVH